MKFRVDCLETTCWSPALADDFGHGVRAVTLDRGHRDVTDAALGGVFGDRQLRLVIGRELGPPLRWSVPGCPQLRCRCRGPSARDHIALPDLPVSRRRAGELPWLPGWIEFEDTYPPVLWGAAGGCALEPVGVCFRFNTGGFLDPSQGRLLRIHTVTIHRIRCI